MKRSLCVSVIVIGVVVCFGLMTWATENPVKKGDFISICKSGKSCGKFETGSKDAAECKCGAETEQLHVLKLEGDVAVVCQCGGGCACDLNAKNPYLCGCGTPVKVVRIVK
jgi:hypothetical protein